MTRAILPLLVLAMAAACTREPGAAEDARGTVELPEVDLAGMAAARVVAIRVEEGAMVRAGDTVAVLGQVDLSATLAAQRARIATAEANLRDLEAGSRTEEVRRAEAESEVARAEVERAGKELVRVRDLAQRELLSRQVLDNAVAAERVAASRLQAAEEALRLLRAGSRPERVQAARAEVGAARAALAQVEARAGDLVLVAPVAGVVLSRNAEPGEALAAGVPVLTLGESARPYVRVFLPQRRVAGLKPGDAVQVVTDEGRTIAAKVAAINPRAEFTPRVALTEKERADLMFGVKVEFDRPQEAPNPGLWVRVRLGGKPE